MNLPRLIGSKKGTLSNEGQAVQTKTSAVAEKALPPLPNDFGDWQIPPEPPVGQTGFQQLKGAWSKDIWDLLTGEVEILTEPDVRPKYTHDEYLHELLDIGNGVAHGILNQRADYRNSKELQAMTLDVLQRYDVQDHVNGLDITTSNSINNVLENWVEDDTGDISVLGDAIGDVLPEEALTRADRADLIANTEVTRIYGESRAELARSKGYSQIVWRTQEDERVCAVCGELGAAEARADVLTRIFMLEGEEFELPAHPNCRCWAEPDTGEEERDKLLDDLTLMAHSVIELYPIGVATAGLVVAIGKAGIPVVRRIAQGAGYGFRTVEWQRAQEQMQYEKIQDELRRRTIRRMFYERPVRRFVELPEGAEVPRQVLWEFERLFGLSPHHLPSLSVQLEAPPEDGLIFVPSEEGGIAYLDPELHTPYLDATTALSAYLDKFSLTEKSGYEGSATSHNAAWKSFWDAVDRSDAATRLGAIELFGSWQDLDTGITYELTQDYARLLQVRSAYFQRAMEEYFALHTNKDAFRQEWKKVYSEDVQYVGAYWETKDFQPIARALEDLLREYGFAPYNRKAPAHAPTKVQTATPPKKPGSRTIRR